MNRVTLKPKTTKVMSGTLNSRSYTMWYKADMFELKLNRKGR